MTPMTTTQNIIVGLVFSLGLTMGFLRISQSLLTDIQTDPNDPDDQFTNSQLFEVFFIRAIPAFMLIIPPLLVSPLLGWVRDKIISMSPIWGFEGGVFYVLMILGVSLFLDVMVFVVKSDYPLLKVFWNTWFFLTYGILFNFLKG